MVIITTNFKFLVEIVLVSPQFHCFWGKQNKKPPIPKNRRPAPANTGQPQTLVRKLASYKSHLGFTIQMEPRAGFSPAACGLNNHRSAFAVIRPLELSRHKLPVTKILRIVDIPTIRKQEGRYSYLLFAIARYQRAHRLNYTTDSNKVKHFCYLKRFKLQQLLFHNERNNSAGCDCLPCIPLGFNAKAFPLGLCCVFGQQSVGIR